MEDKTPIGFRSFLEGVPPLVSRLVKFIIDDSGTRLVEMPTINLYCAGKDCRGLRFHTTRDQLFLPREAHKYIEKLITYQCKNCRSPPKTYALRVTNTDVIGDVLKTLRLASIRDSENLVRT
jgi:hypothetical protein